jgi:tripartite-type tricarboxylate transporter receptor subunit TctC
VKIDRLARIGGILCIAVGLCGVPGVYAQSYPVKPVRVIVPFPPGGPNDLLGRVVGQKLSEQMGQPVIIENRSGAAGNIGSQAELAKFARLVRDAHIQSE